MTPGRLFERRWAFTLLDRVLGQLRDEYAGRGKAREFESLRACLTIENPDYAAIAPRVGVTQSALRVRVHRLRRRYGELLREEIARTVQDPADVDDELRELLSAVGPASDM